MRSRPLQSKLSRLPSRGPRGSARRWLSRGRIAAGLGTALPMCALLTPAASPLPRRNQDSSPRGGISVTLRPSTGKSIPSGFLGLSLEYTAVEPYAGQDPNALDPVFVQLVRNLTLGHPLVLRIGGDSTDWAWWPVPHMQRPPGVTITLTEQWLAETRAVADALNARLILGINLEANSVRLAAAETKALVAGLGPAAIEALELGNEPELYRSFGWYRLPNGKEVPGRPAGYGFPTFDQEFSKIGSALGPEPLAGPTTGASRWLTDWSAFLSDQPRVRIATVHRYGLHDCTGSPASPGYPTPAHLLSPLASAAPAMTVRPFVAIAHAHGVPLRVDEMNSTPCYNVPPTAARSFASALWVLDALFEMASAGVNGVNIHTYPAAPYSLFEFTQVDGRWEASVAAEYYGLLMFAQATPAGSRLRQVAVTPSRAIRAWATENNDHTFRVLLINDGDQARTATLTGFPDSGAATAEALRAPSIAARSGVTLGGRTFGLWNATGTLAGNPQTYVVRRAGGSYVTSVPRTSAVLVTIAGSA